MERGGREIPVVPAVVGSSTASFPAGMLSARGGGSQAQDSHLGGHREPSARMTQGWKRAAAAARITHSQAPKGA